MKKLKLSSTTNSTKRTQWLKSYDDQVTKKSYTRNGKKLSDGQSWMKAQLASIGLFREAQRAIGRI